MGTERAPSEPFSVRLLMVLGALYLFVALVDLVSGTPPPFLAAVGFGGSLGLAVEIQARFPGPIRRV